MTKTGAAAALVLGTLGPLASAVCADVIELKDGHQVVGEVLAEKANALFVDLGFDILRIPRDQIVRRGKPGELPASRAGAAAVDSDEQDATKFFDTTQLKSKPVKELVSIYGEAVVTIETPSGMGSGFILNDQGYTVTNNHVIEGETRIAAVLYQNTSTGLQRRRIENVEIVALNPFIDLALLKLPPQKDLKLAHVVLGNLNDINSGDGVFAIGAPLGLERTVSQGIVSNRNRNFEGRVFLQTDAAINPGNSGGPLFNMRGEVVGVTSLKASRGDNLGFAIPITYVKDFLRNREAFTFDKDNPNTGYRYLDPPRRLRSEAPPKTSQAAKDGPSDAKSSPTTP